MAAMQSEEERQARFAAIMSGVANETGPAEKSPPVDASPDHLKALLLAQKCANSKPAIQVTDQISRLIDAVETATVGEIDIGAKVLAFDQIPRQGLAHNQNIFKINSMCVLELVTYQDLGEGKWQLDFKVLPPFVPCMPKETSLFELGRIVTYADVKGTTKLLSPSEGEAGWILNMVLKLRAEAEKGAGKATGDLLPGAQATGAAKRSSSSAGSHKPAKAPKGSGAPVYANLDPNGNLIDPKKDADGNVVFDVDDDEETKNPKGTIRVGKNVGTDLFGVQHNVADGTGQLAVNKCMFLIRMWPEWMQEEFMIGCNWNYQAFMSHLVDVTREAHRLAARNSVTTRVVCGTDPALHMVVDLHGCPLIDQIERFEMFIRGLIDDPDGVDVSIAFNEFLEDVHDSSAAANFGEAKSPDGRRVISRLVKTFGRMAQCVWMNGLQDCVEGLVQELASGCSAFRFTSDFVTAKECWHVLTNFVRTIKMAKSITIYDHLGVATECTLEEPDDIMAYLRRSCRELIDYVKTNPMDLWYSNYMQVFGTLNVLAGNTTSPAKGKKVGALGSPVSAVNVTSEAEALSAKKKLKKKLAKDKKSAAASLGGTARLTPVKTKDACHFRVAELLGTLKNDGDKVVCELGVGKCKNLHPKKLGDVTKLHCQTIAGCVNTPKKIASDVRAHLLTL